MKKETTEKFAMKRYYTLVRTEHNMFSVEVLSLLNGKVDNIHRSEPTYLPIAFEKLKKLTAQAYFDAVEGE